MDIHKPKPWHGLREFLKEYMINVVGVLTALAAEQSVEWLHWQERVEEGRQALKQEVMAQDRSFVYRIAVHPCVESRLTEMEAIRNTGTGAPFASQSLKQFQLIVDLRRQAHVKVRTPNGRCA